MSKVYSFRLSEDNPREAQARRVIEAWVEEGYSLRCVIIEALLYLKNKQTVSDDYDLILKQLKAMIDGTKSPSTEAESETLLPSAFTAGIVKSIKQGLQA